MTHTQYAIEHDNRLIGPPDGKDTWPMCKCSICEADYNAEAMPPEASVCIEDVCWRVECQQKHIEKQDRIIATLRKEQEETHAQNRSLRRELFACGEVLKAANHPHADIAISMAKLERVA